MNRNLFTILIYFIFYVVLQVLLLDKIHLFRIGTPFLYLYVIIKCPVNAPRTQVIGVSFLLGIVIDMFSNTLGMHAAACSLAGMIRNPLMNTFAVKEFSEGDMPSFQTMGVGGFSRYAAVLAAIHHITLFCIESITLFHPLLLIKRILACLFLTMLTILIVEAFNLKRRKE
ncbi:MAG: rod shape-determining protein MreD [Tannerella sp.]|jgi:rod shape-determining protein MreD|nr:rod shape-determining protein MreD [Tannerella sp.]